MKIPKLLIYALILFAILYLFNRSLATKIMTFGKAKATMTLEEVKRMIVENHVLNQRTRERAFANGVDFEDQLRVDALDYQNTFY